MKNFFIKLIAILFGIIFLLNYVYNSFLSENITKFEKVLSLSERDTRIELRSKIRSELKNAIGLAEKKDSEWEYHDFYNFNGSEADVIVYAVPENLERHIYWPAMSRARKLLVIIANYSKSWLNHFEVLESAVNKGFVTNGEELLDTTRM